MDKKKPYIVPEAHVLMPSGCDPQAVENMSDAELSAYLQSQPVREARKQYRIKEGYCVRELCGESLVIPVSGETIRENQMAILSPVGSFLWDRLNTGQTFGDLMAAVLAEYDVGPDEAAADITEFLSELDAHKYLAIGEENTQ